MYIRKNTIKLSAAIVSVLLMLSSCQSAKEEVSSDNYNQSEQIEVEEENLDEKSLDEEASDNEETNEVQNNTEPTSKTFKSADSEGKSWVKSFLTFGNKDKYIPINETSKIITRDFKGLKEQDATYLLRVDSNLAGFGCPIMGAYFIAQFDDVARAKIAKAAEQYFNDFENKKLATKKNVSKNAYGSIEYKLNWGTLKSSTPNNGIGTGYLGYEFVKNQPYFIIWSYALKNDYYEIVGESTTRESAAVKFYFTRNQLKKLVDTLSEENLENYYFSF